LVADLGFGFWRYMFAQHQFNATGRILLRVFPAKPTSTPAIQYNHTFIFNQLAQINNLRSRIAHHEPICFQITTYKKYNLCKATLCIDSTTFSMDDY
jgi:hypothetical protein